MAGGKETPRQKMVGMMYLVLTALLALNVSSAVLDKFIFLNSSLEQSILESEKKNSNTVKAIQKQVSETGNRKDDVKVLETAEDIRKRTDEVITQLDDLKKTFIEITGGTNEEGKPIGVTDKDAVAGMMIAQKKGEELQKFLNDYTRILSEKTGQNFPKIAYDGKDHPLYKDDKNQKNKDFATLTFEESPMVASLASISQLETEVLKAETQALEVLANKVGAGDLKFDRINAMVRPESKVVAAGTKYVADVFIAASSTGVTPKMKARGKELDVDANGFGRVEFVASANSYNKDGLSEQTFEGEISMSLPGGKDTTFHLKETYFVAKPVVQIQSASVQALYLNCGNNLNVQVPALGANYNPNFSARGGDTYAGAKKGEVTIVPTSKQVILTTASGGAVLGSDTFNVRGIPKPDIVVLDRSGKPVDLKRGFTQPPRMLMFKAVPDESFATFLPEDARYRVAEVEVALARGSRAVKRITVSERADLSALAAEAKPGDRLVIEVKKVQRKNFRDQIEEVRGVNDILSIPMNKD
jgi:gliding motility-associated protein GldM